MPKYGVSGLADVIIAVVIGEGLAIGAVDTVALDANAAELIVLEAVPFAGWNVAPQELSSSTVLITVVGNAFLTRAAGFGKSR